MVKRAIIALTALATLAGAGCGHMSGDDYMVGELGASSTIAAGPMEDADAIIERAHAASVNGGAEAGIFNRPPTTGYIVDNHTDRPYLLDTGDRLRIFVYGQPNLSRLYIVDQSGKVSVPLIGQVRARGLSTVQLEAAIRGRLGQQLVRDPQVTVDVQQNRPFFILGEVRTAGQYPYVTGLTVQTAVAIAGGFGDRASESRARVSRRVGNATEVFDVTPETELEPGDTVYIYERFF